MINRLHLYSAFLTSGRSKRFTFTRSCTHSHTDGGVSHAGRQPAGQEQSGGGVSQGLLHTLLGGALRFPAMPPPARLGWAGRHGEEGSGETATLYVWVGHQVEEAGEQRVGGGVGPSEVEIQGEHHQLI